LRNILQKGISRIVFPKVKDAKCIDELDKWASEEMIRRYKGRISLEEIDIIDDISLCFDKCKLALSDRIIVDDIPKPPSFPPIQFYKEGSSKPEKCNHDWYDVFPSMGEDFNFPSGRRCSKCLKQEWH
jgi:hypothetical protein